MSGLAQDVEVRLGEIDRRLREIQEGLVPGRVPRETRMPAPGRPPPAARGRPHRRSGPLAEALAAARCRRAGDDRSVRSAGPTAGAGTTAAASVGPTAGVLAASLLAAARELLEGYERALRGAAGGGAPEVMLSAGPFRDTGALHAFENALARLPGVREVATRGYDGADRAILEVQLERVAPWAPST